MKSRYSNLVLAFAFFVGFIVAAGGSCSFRTRVPKKSAPVVLIIPAEKRDDAAKMYERVYISICGKVTHPEERAKEAVLNAYGVPEVQEKR